MINKKEFYKRVQEQVERLSAKKAPEIIPLMEELINEYITVPACEKAGISPLVKSDAGYIPISFDKLLSHSEAILQTAKVIGLMEASDNLEEFKTLANKKRVKKKEQEYELTDFDKILKGLLSVPKPTKEEIKEGK